MKCYKYNLKVLPRGEYGAVTGIVFAPDLNIARNLIFKEEICYSIKSLKGMKVKEIKTSETAIHSFTVLE